MLNLTGIFGLTFEDNVKVTSEEKTSHGSSFSWLLNTNRVVLHVDSFYI